MSRPSAVCLRDDGRLMRPLKEVHGRIVHLAFGVIETVLAQPQRDTIRTTQAMTHLPATLEAAAGQITDDPLNCIAIEA